MTHRSIPAIDLLSREQAKEHQNQLTKPTGALGDLEDIACWLAGIQRSNDILSRPAALVLFAADHPVSRSGVSAYPREVTGAMVHNILFGGAASSVLCRQMKLPLYLWDVGVETSYPVPALSEDMHYQRVESTGVAGNLFETDALDAVCFEACWHAGEQSIDQLDPKTKIIIFGEMGIGNTTPAAALCGALLQRQSDHVVGAGTGVSGDAKRHKATLVQKALDRCRQLTDPLDILRCLGGREIVAMVAAMQRAAEQQKAILVDGFIVSAAALVACRMNPAIRPYLYFAHQSAEAGHQLVLKELDARPLLKCGLRLGEGTGALTAYPILEMAVHVHRHMATFSQAQVPDKED